MIFLLFASVAIAIIIYFSTEKAQINDKNHDIGLCTCDYIKPRLNNLTKEQIDEIHARGKITAEEKVKEWENMDLCAPGDAIGSASWRCKKFHHNCHDCLVDYASEKDEYESFESILKSSNFKLNLAEYEIKKERKNE